jgi:IS30 family transposase
LNITGYFARHFASWENGSNENFDGLLREYVTKKRPMNYINDEKIKMNEKRLNDRSLYAVGIQNACRGASTIIIPYCT